MRRRFGLDSSRATFWVAVAGGSLAAIVAVGMTLPAGGARGRPELEAQAAEELGIDLAEVDRAVADAAKRTPSVSDLSAVVGLYGNDNTSFVNEYAARCMASVGLMMTWTPLAEQFPGSSDDPVLLAQAVSPPNPGLDERKDRGLRAFTRSETGPSELDTFRSDLASDRGPELLQRSTAEWRSVNATCMAMATQTAVDLKIPARPTSDLNRREAASLLLLVFDYESWLDRASQADPVLAVGLSGYEACMAARGFPAASIAYPGQLAPPSGDRSVDAALADYECGYDLRAELGTRLTEDVTGWLSDPASIDQLIAATMAPYADAP